MLGTLPLTKGGVIMTERFEDERDDAEAEPVPVADPDAVAKADEDDADPDEALAPSDRPPDNR